MKTLALLAIAVVLPVSVGLADGRGRRYGDDDCFVPMADWQPRDAVEQLAAAHDWTVRRIKVDDGCYKLVAIDADGNRIEAKVNPATLEIIEVEHEGRGHRDGDDD